MNEIQKQSLEIAEQKKKFVPLDCVRMPIGVGITRDDGNYKCRVDIANEKGIKTNADKKEYQSLTYKELFNNWLIEIQPGQIMVAGQPDDSGIIIP